MKIHTIAQSVTYFKRSENPKKLHSSSREGYDRAARQTMTIGKRRGILIVLEGIDGTGKSTQAALLAEKLRGLGVKTSVFREPTDGVWGRKIREKAKKAGSLTAEEELDLFLRDRRDNVEKNIKPALERGETVILDRYYFSTIAYQSAKGLDAGRIRRLNEEFAPPPDLVFILDLDAESGLGRIRERGARDELFEREDYLRKVRAVFRSFRGRRFIRIDALKPIEAVHEKIAKLVLDRLG
jgi:dTMP kinase